MVRVVRAVLVLSLVFVAKDVSANWFRAPAPVVTAYYYYPVPVICIPSFPMSGPTYALPPIGVSAPQTPPQQPKGVAPSQNQLPGYAKPTPAPPSSTAPPGVDESRRSNYYDAYAVERGHARPADRCTVGLWNQSAQSVTVTVAGQPRVLQRGQGVTLELPRRFVWQIEGRDPVQETVADGQAGVDIVIRR